VREYVRFIANSINSAETAQQKKRAKSKEAAFDPRKPKRLTIFVAGSFPAW